MTDQSPFWDVFNGKMYGVLNWPVFDEIWQHLAASDNDWYVWSCTGTAPSTTMPKDDFTVFLTETRSFLVKQDRSGHCGFMYVDDIKDPSLCKLFDPRHMGSSCSCSSEPVMPKWTISAMQPFNLPPRQPPAKTSRWNLFTRS